MRAIPGITPLHSIIDKKLLLLFVAFALLGIAQALFLPKQQATLDRYDLSAGQLSALLITIVVPYLIIWFVALVGYLRLNSYAKSISRSKDGAAFDTIAKGLLLLALWMPISYLVGAQADYFTQARPDLTPLMVMLNNYLNLAFLLSAFYVLLRGSQKLTGLIKKPAPLPQWFLITYLAMSALYVFLVLHDPAREAPAEGVDVATYYLPDWLIVTTIVIPRLIMWFWGAQAVYNVITYRLKVKGTIYKEALSDLAKGIGWVVVAVIVLRGFQSLSTQVNDLGLAMILLVVYLLLILISVGYVLIARGAKKLKRIEDL